MREINLKTWERLEHFETYINFKQPHFGMCANVNVSEFQAFVKEGGHSMTIAMVYLIARTANAIPEFRQRIREGRVIEHEVIYPSTTILVSEDLFTYCTIRHLGTFSSFVEVAEKRMTYVREHPSLEEDSSEDDLLYMTPIPWVSFTSFLHPLPSHPPDSVPRFARGKYFQEGGRLKMPLGVQAHHALMDGVHVGRFYRVIQGYLDRPSAILGKSSDENPAKSHVAHPES